MKICLYSCLLALSLPCFSLGAPALPTVESPADGRMATMAKYLSPGGDFYLAMAGAEWGKQNEKAVAGVEEMLKGALPEDGGEELLPLFRIIAGFLEESGLSDVQGMGASSVTLADGLHHNRLFLQHPRGGGKGFLWEAFTDENRPLAFLERLPANTALARWGVIRPLPAWQWLSKTVAESGNEEWIGGFHEFQEQLAEEGIELERCLASLKGGVGAVATFDQKHPVKLPIDHTTTVEVPAFAAALVVEVKDDTLFDLLGKTFADHGEEFERVEKNGVRELLFPADEIRRSGLRFRVTIARFEDLLVLSTSDALVDELAAKKGGLTATPHFKRCGQAMPQEGFAFLYLNPDATRIAYDAVMETLAAEEPEVAKIVSACYSPLRGLSSWSVTLRTPDGVAVVANQSLGAAELLFTHGPMGQLPLVGGAMIPALVGAGKKADRARDQSNLKQLGLGLIMWSFDNGEKFPDDLGATWEYVNDGHIYVGPGSKTVPPANGDDVRAGRCDYLYFGKGEVQDDKSREMPLACTKPGLLRDGQVNVLYGDGHVEWHAQMPENVKGLIDAAKVK